MSEKDHGEYTVPRKCDECDFETLSRDEYWEHVRQHLLTPATDSKRAHAVIEALHPEIKKKAGAA